MSVPVPMNRNTYIYSDVALDLEEPIVSSDNTMYQYIYCTYLDMFPFYQSYQYIGIYQEKKHVRQQQGKQTFF
jgi:hypothetical protein